MHEIHLSNFIIIALVQYALSSHMKSEKDVFNDFTADETVYISIYIYTFIVISLHNST